MGRFARFRTLTEDWLRNSANVHFCIIRHSEIASP